MKSIRPAIRKQTAQLTEKEDWMHLVTIWTRGFKQKKEKLKLGEKFKSRISQKWHKNSKIDQADEEDRKVIW
jgi:hypothetical protein